jgi:hypothetical protein
VRFEGLSDRAGVSPEEHIGRVSAHSTRSRFCFVFVIFQSHVSGHSPPQRDLYLLSLFTSPQLEQLFLIYTAERQQTAHFPSSSRKGFCGSTLLAHYYKPEASGPVYKAGFFFPQIFSSFTTRHNLSQLSTVRSIRGFSYLISVT